MKLVGQVKHRLLRLVASSRRRGKIESQSRVESGSWQRRNEQDDRGKSESYTISCVALLCSLFISPSDM